MSKKHKKRRIELSHKAKMIIAIGVGVGIVAAIVIALLVIINQRSNDADDGLTGEQIEQRDKAVKQARYDTELQRSASDALKDGDVEKADKVYADAIAAETETARKVRLSVEQSRLLYRVGKIEDAIAIAKEAEALSSDKFYTSDWLARLYENQKEYTLAKQYYIVAQQNTDKPSNVYQFDKQHYDAQIARMTALENK